MQLILEMIYCRCVQIVTRCYIGQHLRCCLMNSENYLREKTMTDNGGTRIVSTQEFREEIETIRHQIFDESFWKYCRRCDYELGFASVCFVCEQTPRDTSV